MILSRLHPNSFQVHAGANRTELSVCSHPSISFHGYFGAKVPTTATIFIDSRTNLFPAYFLHRCGRSKIQSESSIVIHCFGNGRVADGSLHQLHRCIRQLGSKLMIYNLCAIYSASRRWIGELDRRTAATATNRSCSITATSCTRLVERTNENRIMGK